MPFQYTQHSIVNAPLNDIVADVGNVNFPVLPSNQLLYVTGVVTVGTNGLKAWMDGVPVILSGYLFGLASVIVLSVHNNTFVPATFVRRSGVKLLEYKALSVKRSPAQ